MLSYHTCPLATLGGKDTGGMNVYVREMTRCLGKAGVHVDVFTRSQDEHVPHVLHDLGYGNRVVHVSAGPEVPLPKQELTGFLPDFTQGILAFAEKKELTYDLLHSHYWMSGIIADELKSVWGVPVVHMFHTLGIMKQRVARTPGELAQLQWLYQADTKKIVVVPPGVDLSHFYPIPEDEAKEFIGVAPCEQAL